MFVELREMWREDMKRRAELLAGALEVGAKFGAAVGLDLAWGLVLANLVEEALGAAAEALVAAKTLRETTLMALMTAISVPPARQTVRYRYLEGG